MKIDYFCRYVAGEQPRYQAAKSELLWNQRSFLSANGFLQSCWNGQCDGAIRADRCPV